MSPPMSRQSRREMARPLHATLGSTLRVGPARYRASWKITPSV
jgi:hypothetical protein